MGLAICRSIIEAHEGRLWAEANEPRGAIFVLRWCALRRHDKGSSRLRSHVINA